MTTPWEIELDTRLRAFQTIETVKWDARQIASMHVKEAVARRGGGTTDDMFFSEAMNRRLHQLIGVTESRICGDHGVREFL